MITVPVRVGIYARISSDREGDGLGVNRQLEDCRQLAELRGWRVAETYVDDDVSAYSGKPRPEYARMLNDLRTGSINGVLVYHLDRLHRQPKELEEFFEVCKDAGVDDLATVTGRIDLADPDGQFQARILGAVAKKESDDKSRRIRRKHEELAVNGKVSGGGSRPYGYEADKLTVRPVEAAVVKDCARRLLAGEPLRSIAADLNARGVASAGGGLWSPQSLRRMLASARVSGQREHKGEIVATAEWPAIITGEETATIRALLSNPARRTNRAARRYLLHGLLSCSHCGERLVARPRSGGQRRYACAKGVGFSGCGKTYVTADEVERFVTEAVLHRLDSPQLQKAVERRHRAVPETERWWQEAEAASAQLDELADAYGERLFSMREWMTAKKPIQERLTAARKQLAKATHTNALSAYVGNGAGLRAEWDSLDLSQQHAIVAAVVETVVVGPARRGYNRFDESRLTPVWER
ncbi:MAG TPA: recombinase family protein [Plantibacter sp.]|uniref:recombinase family protein n=1 Tax=Plantibacter sp. TaxID=1871045 RepID=UPI002C2913BF|nr:recombinase family protein [Plantibacter sp.]